MNINVRFGNAPRRRRRRTTVASAIVIIIVAIAAIAGKMIKNQPQPFPRVPSPKSLAPK